MACRILVVDDDRDMCELIGSDLGRRGYEVSWHLSGEEALETLRVDPFDVVLTDLNMPGVGGIELCERIVADRVDLPIVVITAFGSLETAVNAIRAGAYDFVTKPIEMDILALVVERASKHRALQEKVRILSQAVDRTGQFGELLGTSPPMQRLFDQLERIADSETSVVIMGESGSGKELVARALHKKSQRKHGPFVTINCSALPETLLESELFGHVRGAFTDAKTNRKGLFLQAEQGALFLDEIGDLPLTLQPKLLRALEEHSVRPIGGDQEVSYDARIITATHQDLESAVEEGRFREDLFFRINVIQLDLPPLRARGHDILLIAHHFLKSFADRSGKPLVGISQGFARKLLNYHWPGNVRELRNVMERAVALTRYDRLSTEDLPDKIRLHPGSAVVIGGNDPSELAPMEEVEQRYILHVLQVVAGNKTQAARILGFDRKTLYRKLVHYGQAEEDKWT